MVVRALPNAIAERKLGPHICPNLNLTNFVEVGPLSWKRWSLIRGSFSLRTKVEWLLHVATGGLYRPPSSSELKQLKHFAMMLEKKCHSVSGTTFCFCKDDVPA